VNRWKLCHLCRGSSSAFCLSCCVRLPWISPQGTLPSPWCWVAQGGRNANDHDSLGLVSFCSWNSMWNLSQKTSILPYWTSPQFKFPLLTICIFFPTPLDLDHESHPEKGWFPIDFFIIARGWSHQSEFCAWSCIQERLSAARDSIAILRYCHFISMVKARI